MTSPHRSQRTLRVASCMAPNADAMCRDLAAYLAQALAISVELVDNVPWQERERLLDAGAIDLCWICGLPYVEKADRGRSVALCVAPVMRGKRYGGSPIYFSDVVVRNDSRYASFDDLEGESWAYNEPRSHSGFNLVRYHLAAQGRTLEYFSSLTEAGTHQEALQLVLARTVAAAAIDSTVLDAELRRNPVLAHEVRAIATLGPSAAPPWVFSDHVPEDVRLAVRECLAHMHRTTAGATILAQWGISELRPVEDRAYDSIRHMARVATGALLLA